MIVSDLIKSLDDLWFINDQFKGRAFKILLQFEMWLINFCKIFKLCLCSKYFFLPKNCALFIIFDRFYLDVITVLKIAAIYILLVVTTKL